MKRIWSLRLSDGKTIHERTTGKPPVEKRITESEIQPFINIWKVRFQDAQRRGDKPMQSHIKKLLLFVEKYRKEELSLQIWVEYKLCVIYARVSDNGFVLSEPWKH